MMNDREVVQNIQRDKIRYFILTDIFKNVFDVIYVVPIIY